MRQSSAKRWQTREDLQPRMVLLMINEAARCLEERIVDTPAEVDLR